MGWKGTLRSLSSLSRSMARSSERAARERQKEQQRQRASEAIEKHESYITTITSIHTSVGKQWDWDSIRKVKPRHPKKDNSGEKEVQAKLDKYEPGFFTKLFGLVERKKKKLKGKVEEAKKEDDEKYQAKMAKYNDKYELYELSGKIIEKDLASYIDALKLIDPFSDNAYLGEGISFTVNSPQYAIIDLSVHSEEIVPKEKHRVLKSGNISSKDMPVTEFYEIYVNHICSSIIRVAREVFAILPLESVFINALRNMVDPQTGHLKDTPILSVYIPRDTLNTLNFDMIVPFDALANFVHNINYKKTKGLKPVQLVNPVDFYSRS